MLIDKLIHNGATYTVMTSDQLREAGVPEKAIEEAEAKAKSLEKRSDVRSHIANKVGDTASLLGTVADGQSILVAVALSDIVALSTATDFDKYKKTRLDALKALSGDADFVKIAGDALAKIKSGDVILTGSIKGLEATLAETLERSTGVATAIIAASGE